MGDHLARSFEHLLRAHAQLVLHVERRSCDEHVDTRISRALYSLPRGIDVLDSRTRKRSYGASSDSLGNRLYRLKISRRSDREASLDYIDVHLFEASGYFYLLSQVHAAAR